jgi:hypothetical protein
MECVEFLLGKQHPFVLGTPYLVVYTRWDCKWMDESIFWDFSANPPEIGIYFGKIGIYCPFWRKSK